MTTTTSPLAAPPAMQETAPVQETKPWGLVGLQGTARPRIRSVQANVLEHRPLTEHYRALTVEAPEIASTALPGQFVMLTLARKNRAVPTLPRPMAIYSVNAEDSTVEILYGVVGDGTRILAGFEEGEQIHVIGPLGQSFNIEQGTRSALLIGRGIGTCSLTTVAQQYGSSVDITAVTSGRRPESLIGADFYRRHDVKTVFEVNDADGTSSPESLMAMLTNELDATPPDVILTCGSNRLITLSETLAERWNCDIQVSVEAHMACGIGFCHGCASGARSEGAESPLICNDGPVFAWERLEGENA